ncbi:M1 family metallopeptidase [Mucilaginibacter auburnensis]|uniref:Aminopeptidase N n=1 Tax=Mucilaginibacter auburnensis TaxID=1457233 RepID=A0A2H9VR89_9SPHI|nr:M1 family metallopeptidase [Mucilaginibacter auburnensis]PJJ83346.1 peptidase M1-like protein [Mucilaginibacter auburnensis]
MLKLPALFISSIFACFVAQAQPPGAIIDVQHYKFNIDLNDSTNNIVCKADVTLKFIKNTRSFNLDLVQKNNSGKGMLISAITEGDKAVEFSQSADKLTINTTGAVGTDHTYTISYQGVPADGLIISKNKYGKRTFFGDNWPNRAHNWLVSVDDPADKAAVDFVVTAPAHYDVVANGLKLSETDLPAGRKQTHWEEKQVLPTKIMVIGVADFAIKNVGNVSGIPVYSYVFPQDSVKGFKSYNYAREILPFFIKKVGPYAYEKLANVQSKTIFGGMENAGAIFYHEESPTDRGIEALMAHEIAHQWFGDAASEKNFFNLWLSEGFATYMTHYYLENKYGIDTLKKRLVADRAKVLAFEKDRLKPVVDTSERRDFMVMLNANSYEKGSWVLHMLRRKLGEEAFWKGIREYYAEYKGGNANTMDFMKVMEKASGKDLDVFIKQWLYTAGHPDVVIKWQYLSNIHTIKLTVTQQQQQVYHFPLDISINGQMHRVDVNSREITANFSSAKQPTKIVPDPNINLLATFAVSKQ